MHKETDARAVPSSLPLMNLLLSDDSGSRAVCVDGEGMVCHGECNRIQKIRKNAKKERKKWRVSISFYRLNLKKKIL